MEVNESFEKYRQTLIPVMHSKREEFLLLGYKDLEIEQLWSYLKVKKWKKNEERMLHQLVEDILSVRVSDYMNYATMEAFKESQRNRTPSLEEFKDLFT